jgi:hypothetical protein
MYTGRLWVNTVSRFCWQSAAPELQGCQGPLVAFFAVGPG